jgi:hypothetical protein
MLGCKAAGSIEQGDVAALQSDRWPDRRERPATPRLAKPRTLGLLATVCVHLAIVAGLVRYQSSDREPPSPAVEVMLVPAPIAPIPAPAPPPEEARATTPRFDRTAEPTLAPPPAYPVAASAAKAAVDASAKYRLLAAPFNACPSLLVQNRLYRPGASDERCEDPEDVARPRSDRRPPAPRQYALDGASHIVFGDKEDALPAGTLKIALKPAP